MSTMRKGLSRTLTQFHLEETLEGSQRPSSQDKSRPGSQERRPGSRERGSSRRGSLRPPSQDSKRPPSSQGSTTNNLKNFLANGPNKAVDRQSLLDAIAKADAGKEWNEVFKNGASRRDEHKMREFWEEFRARLLLKFESVQAALDALDTNGEGFFTFLRFSDLLRMLNIPLSNTVARAIFDKVSGGGRVILADSFRAILVEKTIRSLRFIINSFNQKQDSVKAHIHNFLRAVSSQDEQTRLTCAFRFQQKLTVQNIRSHWKNLVQRMGKKLTEKVEFSKAFLSVMAHETVGKIWQAMEISFLLMLFDKVCSLQLGGPHSRVSIESWVAALICMSSDPDTCSKVSLLCEVYDTDYDSCLLFQQILDLIRCLFAQLPLAQETPKWPLTFRDALVNQEALRIYEQTRWHMHRNGKADNVVTVSELWETWSRMPEILVKLFPGCASARWMATEWNNGEEAVSAMEIDLPLQIESESLATTAERRTRELKTEKSGERLEKIGGRRSSREKLKAARSSMSSDHTAPLGSRKGGVHHELNNFKQTVSHRFKVSLRNFGDQRLAELIASFPQGAVQVEVLEASCGRNAKVSNWEDLTDDLASTSLVSASRPSTTFRRSSRSVLQEKAGIMSRSASAPSFTLSSGLGFTTPPVPARPAPRGLVSTAGLSRTNGNATSQGDRPASKGNLGLLPSSAEIPYLAPLQWGAEARPRVSLVSSAKYEITKHPALRVDDEGDLRDVCYRCQLCQWNHNLCPHI